jgi:hypothetical protein
MNSEYCFQEATILTSQLARNVRKNGKKKGENNEGTPTD